MPSIGKVAGALQKAAAVFRPGEYALVDKPIHCPHCGGRVFQAGAPLKRKTRCTAPRVSSEKTGAVLRRNVSTLSMPWRAVMPQWATNRRGSRRWRLGHWVLDIGYGWQ